MVQDFPLSNKEKTHYTNMWCQSIGIKSKDLDAHPQIDDVILLIKFRQSNWQFMNASERGVWASAWSWVYHNQYSIKAKSLKKLEHIVESVIIRQDRLKAQREAIKRKRNQNRDVNMKANPSLAVEFSY